MVSIPRKKKHQKESPPTNKSSVFCSRFDSLSFFFGGRWGLGGGSKEGRGGKRKGQKAPLLSPLRDQSNKDPPCTFLPLFPLPPFSSHPHPPVPLPISLLYSSSSNHSYSRFFRSSVSNVPNRGWVGGVCPCACMMCGDKPDTHE